MFVGKYILRVIHGIITIFFFLCIIEIYFSFFTHMRSVLLNIALISGAMGGFLVYGLNKGDCPLIHLQKRLGDTIPFFELFLPKKFAKKVIPVAAIIAIIGVILLLMQHFAWL